MLIRVEILNNKSDLKPHGAIECKRAHARPVRSTNNILDIEHKGFTSHVELQPYETRRKKFGLLLPA